MGQPEFETYVFVRHPNADAAVQYRCTGAQGTPYYYDQNVSLWSGSVELVSAASMDLFRQDSSRLVMFVWEDDVDDCTIKKDADWLFGIYSTLTTLLSGFTGIGVAIGGDCPIDSPCWILLANLTVAPFDIFSSLHEDDFVGELVPTSIAGPCYNGNHVIVGGNGSYKGCVQVSGVGIVPPPPPPPPPLVASIDGPTFITTKGSYTWTATRSGGSGGYTYQWQITYLNTGTTYTLGTAQAQSLVVYAGDGAFEMSVRVTSGGTNSVLAAMQVEEDIASGGN